VSGRGESMVRKGGIRSPHNSAECQPLKLAASAIPATSAKRASRTAPTCSPGRRRASQVAVGAAGVFTPAHHRTRGLLPRVGPAPIDPSMNSTASSRWWPASTWSRGSGAEHVWLLLAPNALANVARRAPAGSSDADEEEQAHQHDIQGNQQVSRTSLYYTELLAGLSPIGEKRRTVRLAPPTSAPSTSSSRHQVLILSGLMALPPVEPGDRPQPASGAEGRASLASDVRWASPAWAGVALRAGPDAHTGS